MTNNNNIPSSLYKDKILKEIIEPVMHYYGVSYDRTLIQLFCNSLSCYDYDVVCAVRNELLQEYRTFPKLPNWIDRCKERKSANNTPSAPQIIKEFQDIITRNQSNIHWQKVQQKLKEIYGENTYNAWLSKLQLIRESENKIFLSAENGFMADWITREYLFGLYSV